MSKHINNWVLVGIMTAGISCLSPLAFAIDNADANAIDADVQSTLGASEEHNKKMDDLNREKELLELQSSLAKLKLEKEKTSVELNRLKGLPTAVAVPEVAVTPVAMTSSQDFSQMNQMPSMGGFAGQTQSPAGAHKVASDTPLDRVYVTRVYGVGGVRSVTVYFDNGIFTGVAGDEIISGLRIAKVTDNGALFSYKGKTRMVNLTTQGLAYSRSQTKQKEARELSDQAPAFQGVNGGFMSNMATEINGQTNIPPPHPR